MNLAVMVSTGDLRIVWVSAGFTEYRGLSAQELVGRSIVDVLETSSSVPLGHLFSRAATTGQWFDDLRVRFTRAEGSTDEFELQRVRYVNGSGSTMDFVRLLPTRTRPDARFALGEAEQRYGALARGTADGVVVHDGTRILFGNAAAAEMIGLQSNVVPSAIPITSLVRAEDETVFAEVCRKLDVEPLTEHRVKLRLRALTGAAVPVDASFARVFWQGQSAIQVVFHDLRSERQSLCSNAAREGLQNAVSDAVISTDANLRILSWNAAATEMYGWSVGEILGRRASDVLGTPDLPVDVSGAIGEVTSPNVWRRTVRHRHRDGYMLTVDSSTTILRDDDDIVEGLVSVNRAVRWPAGNDARHELTGLTGRASLLARLECVKKEDSTVVVVVDIDHFTQLNTRFGSAVGDGVLVGLAARLSGSVRGDDFVVHLSGDRFGVCVVVEGSDEAHAVAERLQTLLGSPVDVDGMLLSVSVSLGATWGLNGGQARRLFEQAESALVKAQGTGGRLCFYEPDSESGGWNDDAIFAAEVRKALATGEIHVAYQPIVELASGQLRQVEALARWDHPERGAVPPNTFIPLAERSGVIDELGEWILHQACTDMVKLGEPGKNVDLNVNISVAQLRDPGIAQRVASVLSRSGLSPNRLWFEVTESVLVDGQALLPLHQLHDLGVHLVIDDFGTGYAMFHNLTLLPVDGLKIEMSFVHGLGVDASDTAIVRSVINLGRELGLQVVAEGVETESQRTQLLALNCRLAQGWLFGRAVPYDELVASYGQTLAASPAPPALAYEAIGLTNLDVCKLLETGPDAAFDALVQLASQLLSTPMALISFIDADRQWWCKASVGVDVAEARCDLAFCVHPIPETHQTFLVPDTALDSRFACNPLVTGARKVRSHAGVPIRSREGFPLGTLCVLDTTPRTFSEDEVGLLKLLANQAAALFDLRRRPAELIALAMAGLPAVRTLG